MNSIYRTLLLNNFKTKSGSQLILSNTKQFNKIQFIRRSFKRKQMSESNYNYNKEVLQSRKTQFPIHPLLLSRWSPREMTGEQMNTQELMSLFEASRWAPSHFNVQPWRFIYAKKDSIYWQPFIDLLWPLNQKWCINASVLVIVVSAKYFTHEGKQTLNPTHSFDSGSAWLSLALEGSARGLVVHGLGGFNYENALKLLKINPESYKVDAMIAIGKRPEKTVRKMKENITQRMPIEKFVFEGEFTDKGNK